MKFVTLSFRRLALFESVFTDDCRSLMLWLMNAVSAHPQQGFEQVSEMRMIPFPLSVSILTQSSPTMMTSWVLITRVSSVSQAQPGEYPEFGSALKMIALCSTSYLMLMFSPATSLTFPLRPAVS